MKYLLITKEGVTCVDELLFKHFHEVTAKNLSVVRKVKDCFEILFVPEDWTRGELSWVEISGVHSR